MVLGIGALASVVLSKILQNFSSGVEQGRVLQNIATLQENVKSTIIGVKSWQKTQEKNPNLKCLIDRTDCRGLGGPIVIYNADGTSLVDATLPNSGFNRDGVACTKFDATKGSEDCPFRYEVEWEPICSDPNAACLDPQVRIVADLKYKTPRPVTLNIGRFRLDIVRGVQTQDGFCQNMGGIWDAVNAKCDLSDAICTTMGGTMSANGKCLLGWMNLDCGDDKVLRGLAMIGGTLLPDCVDIDTTLDTESLSLVPWNWNDPRMRTIPQQDIVGCVVTPGALNAPNADAGGLPCLRNRAAGYKGTCYYRNTGNQNNSGWFRVGSGFCKGGVYTSKPVNP
jgi:hypothetical protein